MEEKIYEINFDNKELLQQVYLSLTAATRFTISDKGADDKELLFFTRVII